MALPPDLLTRGVANIIPSHDELQKVLSSGQKLNIYLGIDPTATRIHLGHAVVLRKLQQFVSLGHHVTFLIGDFTALIGDTSDKDKERPVLTREQIEINFQTYKNQAAKILSFDSPNINIRHNSEWLGKLNFEDIVKLTRNFTLNDFISRELIKNRLEAGNSISLPEVLYPVMQGYDSYFMDTDLQIGGTDQTFNMQAGRSLQKKLRNKESYVLSVPFLDGTDGRKMSKSWSNAIWLEDEPNDMYGKIMSLKDDLILQYFTLATNVPDSAFTEIKSRLAAGENPMLLKKELAHTIVTELHGQSAADTAQRYFEQAHQQQVVPADLSPLSLHDLSDSNILTVLASLPDVGSRSAARRLIDQGAVEINGQKITSYELEIHSGDILKSGKKLHFKLR